MNSVRIGIAWLLVALTAGAAEAPPPRAVIDAAIDAVYPSLVRIHVVSQRPSSGRMLKMRSSGSGAIIDAEGHVLTNHHVAGKAIRLRCRLSDRTELEASLVGTDPMTDLAVLKLDLSDWPKDKKLPVAVFGDSDRVTVGDEVLAMGSPAGLSQSVTRGIASNVAMILPGHSGGSRLDGENVGQLVRWIGHDAVIYPGNSGGPLVDLNGRIVGINEIGIGSLGGAIPSNLARSVAAQLIAGGGVKRSWTGLECQPLLKNSPLQRGVLVAGVIKDSPADRAGIVPGNIITRYDGVEVNVRTPEELPLFYRIVLSTPVGKDVNIELSNGKPVSCELKTEAREPSRGRDVEVRAWGLTARDFTLMSALENRRENKDGVQVFTVRNGGPAREAKPPLTAGDVVLSVAGQAVKTLYDLRRISAEQTGASTEAVPVLVEFERGTARMMTVVHLGGDDDTGDPTQVRKPWLGLQFQVLTRDLARALDLKSKKGIRVTEVLTETPASKAGLAVGDIVTRLDGEIIAAREPEDRDVFTNMIRQYKVGSEVEFEVYRGGAKTNLTVNLSARPTPPEELPEFEDEVFEFTAREVSFGDRKRLEIDRGVMISDVVNAGWAALAGLRAADILLELNGTGLNSIDDLEKAMEGIRTAKPRHLVGFIRRGIHSLYLEFEPDWENGVQDAGEKTP